ncbi:hypothetical protein MBLNU459_g6543t2 [Dothideomycetes sp. NU459]
MSRSNYRRSDLDLAYGDEPPPQRWDRERFERFQRQPEERETFRFSERDRGGRQEIRVEDRIERESPAPARRFEERDIFREERYGPPARIRRSDRELFGGEDPREIAERSLAPYRRKSIVERDVEFREVARPRPGLIRRQSSLDTFDRRRPVRYEREEYRLPPNVPIPLPRRRSPSRTRGFRDDEFEEIRYRDASPHRDDYREMEIMRERTVRKRSRAKSDVRSVTTKRSSSSSSSSESFEQVSRASSPASTVRSTKVGKKGKTRMPKRLVKKQAIIDLGYPFEEEEDFIIVRRALGKEQIDEVIRISENYKEPKTTTYRFEETIEAPAPPPEEHYEALRTEWINPPSVRAPSVRAPSPARSTRTRRSSPPRSVRAPSPPAPVRQETIYIRDPPPPPPPQQPLTIVLPERRERSDRDLQAEIAALQAEARAVRYEREAPRGEVAIRVREPQHIPHPEGYEVVEFRERRPERQELVEYVERARSPKREVVRIEKDRKGRMALVRSAR